MATSATNSSGQASYAFQPFFPFPGTLIQQTTITAAVGSSSVQFSETSVVPAPLTGVPPVTVALVSPTSPPPLMGTSGQTGTPIQVQVTGFQGELGGGVPGIALQLVPATGGPTVACMSAAGQEPGVVLTDSTGTATCTPVFGTPGTGSYQIVVGDNFAKYFPTELKVSPPPPSILKVISGNNQTLPMPELAPLPLVAEVEGMTGTAVPGVSVTWKVTQGSATLSNTVNTSASNGQVSTNVTPTATGQVQVQVTLTGTSTSVTFTVNVVPPVSQFTIVSGNNQTVMTGAAFAPLVVQVSETVNGTAQPAANVTVDFAVTSGTATLGAASVTTNAQGQATETVTASSTSGPVVITATVPGTTLAPLTFDLIASSLSITSITNAAGFQPGFISPCSLATIFGAGLATGIQGVVSSFIEPMMQMAGVSATFAGAQAPILAVVNENGQQSVNLQVPCDVTPGATPLVVTVNGASVTLNVNVMPFSPGVFQAPDPSDGKLRAVALRPDGSYVSVANPARQCEVIRAFATGMGQTTPPMNTDELYGPLVNGEPEDQNVADNVIVGINNAGAVVVAAKHAQGMVGVYEVDFQVPAGTTTGNNAPFAVVVWVNTPQGISSLFSEGSAIPIATGTCP